MKMTSKTILAGVIATLVSVSPVWADGTNTEKLVNNESDASQQVVLEFVQGEPEDLGELAAKLNNPISDLWMLFTQNDTYQYEDKAGNDYTINSFKFQPVMSFGLSEDYNLIVRPVVQHLSMEALGKKRETGMGDTAVFAVVGPATPVDNNIWGVGFTSLIPTASKDFLSTQGADQWAVGPAVTAFHLGDEWVYGGVVQHWWGMGDSKKMNLETKEEEDLNLTDIQYVLRYRVTPTTQIGFGPNIQIDWNESGSDKYTIPVGFGGDTMIKIGSMPVRLGAELHYYVQQADEFGPTWNLRFFAIPVISNPMR